MKTREKQELYEEDYNLWVNETVKQLRSGELDKVDMVNLIEEVESLGRSEKNALESNLSILIMHLLKWRYQSSKRSNSWRLTIVEHRSRIIKALKNSPSLHPYYQSVFTECYVEGVKYTSAETGLPKSLFPSDCPFSETEVLDEDYFPSNHEN